MKKSLVDVPVRIQIWIRPEMQRKQFEVIKRARPSQLFLLSDGGRNDRDWELININRKLYDTQVDWDCEIYKLYLDENHGMYGSGKLGLEHVFGVVDRAILLEDDDIPSDSFVPFCAEMFERYKDDLRIGGISGTNPFGTYDAPTDYIFSRVPFIHGIALWKRFYDSMKIDVKDIDKYYKENIKAISKEDKLGRRFDDVFRTGKAGNHIPWVEFFLPFNAYAQNQLYITPTKNLVTNIGVGEDATHGTHYKELPRVLRKYFIMTESYNLDFPLKHPDMVIRDIQYERQIAKILGYNPLSKFAQTTEKFILAVRYGDWDRIKGKLNSVINKEDEK